MEEIPVSPSRFKVKRYLIKPLNIERWIVVGRTREYIVSPNYCSCKSSTRIRSRDPEKNCKHIQELLRSQRTEEFDTITVSVEEYRRLRKIFLDFESN